MFFFDVLKIFKNGTCMSLVVLIVTLLTIFEINKISAVETGPVAKINLSNFSR